MTVVICGTIAFDVILAVERCFGDLFPPTIEGDLSVAFCAKSLRREFGGCGANISYNLSMLGVKNWLVGAVGEDSLPFIERLREIGAETRQLYVDSCEATAQVYITTDPNGNQISVFLPAAMNNSNLSKIPPDIEFDVGVVSPDSKQAMLEHAEQLVAKELPFVFDPGQALSLFEGQELRSLIEEATWLIANRYEMELLGRITGWSINEITERVDALVVTCGADGSIIHAEETIIIPAVPAAVSCDPTGCGDAYRAGLVCGILRGLDWATCGRLGALLASYNIASQGSQNHEFTRESAMLDFSHVFGYHIELSPPID